MSTFEKKGASTNTDEAKKAILEGNALPTPAFALEQGGEIKQKLDEAWHTMNQDEKESFQKGLSNLHNQLVQQKEFSEQELNWIQRSRFAQFFIGTILGLAVDFTAGTPGVATAIGGYSTMELTHILNGLSTEKHDELIRKLEYYKDARRA